MIGEGGDFFWLMTGATALLLVGGGLALALARGADADENSEPRR